MLSATRYRGTKGSYGFNACILMDLRKGTLGPGDEVEYFFTPQAVAGSVQGKTELLALVPNLDKGFPTIRVTRAASCEEFQIAGAPGLSSFANNLLVFLKAKPAVSQWTEQVKLFDLKEKKGCLPDACNVAFVSDLVQVGADSLRVVQFEFEPFSIKIPEGRGAEAACHCRGVLILKESGRRLMCAAWSFKADVLTSDGPAEFEDRYLMALG